MFRRCLFCHGSMPESGALAHVPRGRRLAYDPAEGRLWVICSRCHRWNLVPLEDRGSALHELERAARDRGRLLSRTAHVSLLQAGPMTLVRVGKAGLPEQAWWRYGRELRRRRHDVGGLGSRLTAATFGAAAYLGDLLGFADPDRVIDWKDDPVADILRWRRFGWAAWYGRQTCPFCNSTLRALPYEMSWWVYPLEGPDGRIGLGVPCQRCDPWTPEKLYRLHGDTAENVLRRVLAYQNIAGAGERRIADAARVIEASGSAGAFALDAARRGRSLWKMGPTGAVALEIALNETVERRLLDLEARALEFVWRQEEQLARIIDEELTPRRFL